MKYTNNKKYLNTLKKSNTNIAIYYNFIHIFATDYQLNKGKEDYETI